jgi:hypothetical protein
MRSFEVLVRLARRQLADRNQLAHQALNRAVWANRIPGCNCVPAEVLNSSRGDRHGKTRSSTIGQPSPNSTQDLWSQV